MAPIMGHYRPDGGRVLFEARTSPAEGLGLGAAWHQLDEPDGDAIAD
jgi:hypothetical protein